MTLYELMWLATSWRLPAHPLRVRRNLRGIVKGMRPSPPVLLDVGGRQSQYTIGLPAKIVITDIPRESDIQQQLRLGITGEIEQRLRKNRSNIDSVILEDMVRSTLPDASFDGVICVEVIEHVEEFEEFVHQMARVTKPGGFLYLTTPNGEWCKNEGEDYNPDHVQHFTRSQLEGVLKKHYSKVDVTYGIKTGKWRYRGLRSPTLRHPEYVVTAAFCNCVSRWESRTANTWRRTAHLFATAQR
jgi:SAM-dependent methyltransferase